MWAWLSDRKHAAVDELREFASDTVVDASFDSNVDTAICDCMHATGSLSDS
jgi:hypothetical protein